MALLQSRQVKAGYATPSMCDANEFYATTGEYVFKTGDAIGDIIEIGGVPPGAMVLDVIVHTGALGASVTLDAGLISGELGTTTGAARTMGNEFFAAQAAATASVIRCNKSLAALPVADINAVVQAWGLKILGAAPTAGTSVRATLICQPAPVGM